MRYDTAIYFQRMPEETYDEATGNYSKAEPTETARMASVMDTARETLHLLFGKVEQGSLTIHLQNHYDDPFDYIRVGDKRYAVRTSRRLRTKHVFIVSEVQ